MELVVQLHSRFQCNRTMSLRRLKVLLLGPSRAGKTVISTYLSDTIETVPTQYRPTQGVRIIEFESYELMADDIRVEPDVELWDCSGDRRFEQCWPAFRRYVDAVILVGNVAHHKGEDLLPWYHEFVFKGGLRHDQVLVLLHHTDELTNDSDIAAFRLPSDMAGISCVTSNIDKEGEQLRHEFTKFLNAVSRELENRGG
ncbi:Rab-like protein 5 [Aphelenchoides besseyi]|nr:Rab-like protein 5 [Aphelenchoides besseyi]